MSLGGNIRNTRKSLKLSQEYVAEKIDVSRQAVSKWENCQSEPSTDNLIKLADLFGIDLQELVSPEQSSAKKTLVERQVDQSKTDIKMQMAACFGRVFMLVGFVGYMNVDEAAFGSLPAWFPYIWWGVLFLIGVVLTFVGAWDYLHRKSGSKKIIWLDVLFVLNYFLYDMLSIERDITTLIILLVGTLVLILKNMMFFIPAWRR